MRIAYLTGEYPRATDTFVQREVAALRELGVEISTVSVRRPDSRHAVGPEQQAERQNTHYLLPASPARLLRAHSACLRDSPRRYLSALKLAWKTRSPGMKAAIYQLFYFAEAALVVRHLHEQRIAHVHNHFANSSCSLSMIAAEMGGLSFSFTMHGPAIFFEPHRWRLDEKIRRARFVACISHFCRSQGMIFSRPENWPKLHIIHCGVDPSHFSARIEPRRGKRLLFVGRLAAVKGLPLLLEAFASIAAAHPDARLTLVGDGPDRASLEREVEARGLAQQVEFAGYQSQASVRDYLAQSDVFVLPSFAEGVPVVLMEAMAAGVPVVTTRIAGVPELVEDGRTGLLVPPGDAASLVEALETLFRNPDLSDRLAEAARARVCAEFNLLQEAERLRSIFQRRLAGLACPVRPTLPEEDAQADEAGEICAPAGAG